jgi:hypothetical protein
MSTAEFNVRGDAKLGGGYAYPLNVCCDGGGRAMTRDLSFVAWPGLLSSGQG